ncbi:MAG: hypothetical protein CFE32_23640 [Alphaproteobacteria bacterium PA3]|nr:MAG: hypothetical protein CFE32_23640 [Alphaproteobacteria bacterium PA3]
MPETTPAQVATLDRADSVKLATCVIAAGIARPAALHDGMPGVTDRLLIGAEPIAWPHGFTVAEIELATDAAIPAHRLAVPDVWFVAEGTVEVAIGEETALCGPGDTITVPQGAARALANRGQGAAKVVQVRGGDTLPVPEPV